MKFVSRRVEKVDDTHLKITGDLTIRGVTRSVVLDTEMLGMLPGQRSRRVAFTATTVIDRNNFGVSFNRLMEGAAIVGAEVQITIDIEAIQPVGG
jgi:polyisoprenoid-binding protein YceI